MKIIDLFAGCGGLSKGFEMAGFEIPGFVEFWDPAIKTHKRNFPNSILLGKDITEISNDDIKDIQNKIGKIDGIVGGPPCQGFSTIGKRDKNDPRNSLFKDFLRFVDVLEPKFFLMENVRGILSTKTQENEFVIEIIINEFEKLGYKADFKLLNAADYGVPQMRNRVFVFGSKKGVINTPKQTNNKTNYITLEDAISNLPSLNMENLGNEEVKIKLDVNNAYQEIIQRNSNGVLYNHIIKKPNELDVERYQYIPEGRYMRSITPGGLKNDIFPDERLYMSEGETAQQKLCRLDRNKPSWTVLTDWYTMRQKAHYSQPRPFSIREVARIQSFQDSFIFEGDKISDFYTQIGNAVPPLLAYSLAKEIKMFFSDSNYISGNNEQLNIF